jgi:hypothetical protein
MHSCIQCTDYSPCFNGSNCVNTVPGFQCLQCPVGYSGSFADALSIDSGLRVYSFCGQGEAPGTSSQQCEDVDECTFDNGGCDTNSYCYNTVVSN